VIGYRPSSVLAVVEVAGIVAANVGIGVALTRRCFGGARAFAWLALTLAVVGAERLTSGEPGGFRMLAICAALLFGFKAVVGTSDLAAGRPPLPAGRWLGFVLAWPGMDPEPFVRRGAVAHVASSRRVLAYLSAGAAMMGMARVIWLWTANAWLATPFLLLGLSLVLHFGLFGLASALWRRSGFACGEAFAAPQKSASLADFWGRRWNRPFSDLMRKTVFGSVARHGFPASATYAAFLASGLLHELAISVPARAGYGRPVAYFALQGLFVLAERRWPPSSPNRLRTSVAVLAPLPLLMIPEFLRTAIWPIIGIS